MLRHKIRTDLTHPDNSILTFQNHFLIQKPPTNGLINIGSQLEMFVYFSTPIPFVGNRVPADVFKATFLDLLKARLLSMPTAMV